MSRTLNISIEYDGVELNQRELHMLLDYAIENETFKKYYGKVKINKVEEINKGYGEDRGKIIKGHFGKLFKRGDIFVKCETEEESYSFLELVMDWGIPYWTNGKLIARDKTYWEKGSIYFHCSKGLGLLDIPKGNWKMTVLTYKELMERFINEN